MDYFIAVYAVVGGLCFITACVVTLLAALDGYPEEAKKAARVALCSVFWPIALPLALVLIAAGVRIGK